MIVVSLCVSRPAHDISLEEFDDEDLSEITDDCGIGLNYDSDPYEKVSLCFHLFPLIDISGFFFFYSYFGLQYFACGHIGSLFTQQLYMLS